MSGKEGDSGDKN